MMVPLKALMRPAVAVLSAAQAREDLQRAREVIVATARAMGLGL